MSASVTLEPFALRSSDTHAVMMSVCATGTVVSAHHSGLRRLARLKTHLESEVRHHTQDLGDGDDHDGTEVA